MLKKTLFAAMFLATLSAGALSVRQLRTVSATATCGGTCSATVACTSPCFICLKAINSSTGICVRRD
ncbi:MAG TPA: hypothetical protein VJW20_15085 [Candidatus Angelobacter sp.]|nr:hypothetical protein [Candidatus Angelobacter sp.]